MPDSTTDIRDRQTYKELKGPLTWAYSMKVI